MSPSQRTPWVTLLLIGATIASAFALLWRPELVTAYGFYADRPGLASAFASMFLHLNVIHLLGNMVFLAAVGPSVESSVGGVKTLVLYIVGGLAGAGFHALVLRGTGPTEPLIGASAAVASLVGYAAVRYGSNRVPILPGKFLRVWIMAGVWIVLQALGGFVQFGDPGGGVAYWAHLGGILVGVLLSLVFRAPHMASIQRGHDTMDSMQDRGPAAVLAAADRHLARHPNDPRALHEKAVAHRQLGESDEELAATLALIDALPDSEFGPVVSRLQELGALSQLPGVRRMRLAEQLRESSPDAARALLESVIDGLDEEPQRPDALLALAILEQDEHPERSSALLSELLGRHPMHPAAEFARVRGLVG